MIARCSKRDSSSPCGNIMTLGEPFFGRDWEHLPDCHRQPDFYRYTWPILDRSKISSSSLCLLSCAVLRCNERKGRKRKRLGEQEGILYFFNTGLIGQKWREMKPTSLTRNIIIDDKIISAILASVRPKEITPSRKNRCWASSPISSLVPASLKK